MCCMGISYRPQWGFCEPSTFVSPDTSECHFVSMWITQPVKKTTLVGFSYAGERMHLNSDPACTISWQKSACSAFQVATQVMGEIHCHITGVKKVFCLGWEFLSGVSYTFLWKCLQSDWTWQVSGLIYMTTATFLRKLCGSICVPRKMQIWSTFYFLYPIKVSLSASGILRSLNSVWW